MGEELVPLRIGRELNLISDWVGCWIGLGAGAEATILIWVRPLCDSWLCARGQKKVGRPWIGIGRMAAESTVLKMHVT